MTWIDKLDPTTRAEVTRLQTKRHDAVVAYMADKMSYKVATRWVVAINKRIERLSFRFCGGSGGCV